MLSSNLWYTRYFLQTETNRLHDILLCLQHRIVASSKRQTRSFNHFVDYDYSMLCCHEHFFSSWANRPTTKYDTKFEKYFMDLTNKASKSEFVQKFFFDFCLSCYADCANLLPLNPYLKGAIVHFGHFWGPPKQPIKKLYFKS